MTAPDKHRTGGDIDAFCTKCDLELTHTILAMVGTKVVKVKCNTCGADHAFRGDKAPPRVARPATVKKAAPTWSELFRGRSLTGARKYSAKESFQVGDVIVHATFGIGLVTGNRTDKIDVVFQAFEKTLVNGKA